MLTDSERFAFSAWRIHAFASTGNAYDAVQTDETIAAGDTLLILDERVVGGQTNRNGFEAQVLVE